MTISLRMWCRTTTRSALVTVLAMAYCFLSDWGASPSDARESADVAEIRAFSIGAAQRVISSGRGESHEIRTLAGITKVWAVMLQGDSDIIIIGEPDAASPPMQLDDAVIALRCKDKISSGENPGVSIEPVNFDRYCPNQRVIYFGGIDSTHFGKVCYESDLLLKSLSLGFSLSGVHGLPNEWDLQLDNAKAGRNPDPWGRSLGRSWFFPLQVRMTLKDDCVALTAITMGVKTDLERELEIEPSRVRLDRDSISALLNENPEAVSFVYAQLFTQYFDEIALHHPVLLELRNLIALSGMMAQLLRGRHDQHLSYWLNDFQVQRVAIQPEVPTFSRAVNGLSFNAAVSGGVQSSFEVDDAWVDAILSRKPRYLRLAALRSRPSPDAVSWIIPLNLSKEEDSTRGWLLGVSPKETNRTPPRSFTFDSLPSKTAASNPNPSTAVDTPRRNFGGIVRTPGWHPGTDHQSMIALKWRLFFSSGGFELFSPDGRFSITGSEISAGAPLSIEFSHSNLVGLELTLPFKVMMSFQDHLTDLPGISEQIVAYSGGVGNPVLMARLQILSGILHNRWLLPTLALENSLVIPVYGEMFDGFLSGEKYKDELSSEFGTRNLHGSHALESSIPLLYNLRLSSRFEYQTGWRRSSFQDRMLYSGDCSLRLSSESGSSLGFRYATSSSRESGWLRQGSQYLIFLGFPTRCGANTFWFGWYQPSNSSSESGQFLMSIDLSGTSLWDWRYWF